MRKILLILFVLFLSACGTNNNISINNIEKKQVSLSSISTGNVSGLFVGVTDPHIYSKQGPLLISGSYYFNPYNFYRFNKNLFIFMKAYSSKFNNKPVYYYDENNGAQAGIVVYVLRNIYNKKNVSLWINSSINSSIKKGLSIIPVNNTLSNKIDVNTGGYIGTGKYLVVYDPTLISFKTGDLLLYSSDFGTMKQDAFYIRDTGIDIKNFDWSKLIDIDGTLKSYKKIHKLLEQLDLKKYNKVYIYYPKYWYRSGVLALYLQQYDF